MSLLAFVIGGLIGAEAGERMHERAGGAWRLALLVVACVASLAAGWQVFGSSRGTDGGLSSAELFTGATLVMFGARGLFLVLGEAVAALRARRVASPGHR